METIVKNQDYQSKWDSIKSIDLIKVSKGFVLLFLIVIYIFICSKISGLREEGSEQVIIESSNIAREADNSIYFIITLAVPLVAFTLLFYLQNRIKDNKNARDTYFEKQINESIHKQLMAIKGTEHLRLLKELTEARKIHDNQNLEYIRLSENATKEAFHWREQAYSISNKIQHNLTIDSETLDIAEARLANPSIYDVLLNRVKSWLKGKEGLKTKDENKQPKQINGKEIPIQGMTFYNKTITSNINHLNQ